MTFSLLLIVAMTGCSPKKEPGEQKPVAATTPTGTAPISANNGKELRLSAEALTLAFEKDFSDAKEVYGGKIVEISGPFDRLARNRWAEGPEVCVILRGVDRKGSENFSDYRTVTCEFTNKQLENDPRLRTLSQGQEVTIRGTIQNIRHPSMTDCTIVSIGRTRIVRSTLAEIEKEVSEDGTKFGRFDERSMVLTLTIGRGISHVVGMHVSFYARRPEGSKNDFKFFVTDIDKELAELKEGDKILVLASLYLDTLCPRDTFTFQAVLLKSVPEGIDDPAPKK